MLTRNKKLKDYGIPAEDIEKLNTMLKDFPTEYGYLLSSAALPACPKNTVIADMVIENILHRKSYRKISKEKYIPMNPKDFYGYRHLDPIEIPFPSILNFYDGKISTYREAGRTLYKASEIVEDEEKIKDAVKLVRTFAKYPDRTALTDTFIESLKLLADTVESQMEEVK